MESIGMVEFELKHYLDIFVENKKPKSVREADDCIDFVLMYERDHHFMQIWPDIALLYKICMKFLKENTAICEDPIMGEGRYNFELLKHRYEYKQRILRGYANRLGYRIV